MKPDSRTPCDGPDFNREINVHADIIAERFDAEQEDDFCQCGNALHTEKEKRDTVCRECL